MKLQDMKKDERIILGAIWAPFIMCFIGSFLPDPLFILNMSPDFGMEPELFIFPNFFRLFLFGFYLNPFYVFLCLVLSYCVIDEGRDKTKKKRKG